MRKLFLLLTTVLLIFFSPAALAQTSSSPQSAMSILRARQLNHPVSASPSAIPTQPSIQIFIIPQLTMENIPVLGGIIHYTGLLFSGIRDMLNGKF